MSSPQRNTVISICKGIAIILMVVGHAEAPGIITNFIYTFHMPLFFMAAGYFFSRKYLADPWTFISKRISGLYFPFLKWGMIFLLLHNVWFHFGILNEEYGNWTGGVTHPYTLRQALARMLLMATGMSGYDEFMAGAFWFFRGLLVASVVFLLLYRLIDSRTRLAPTPAVAVICLSMLVLVALRVCFNLKITVIPNGGWRETWGIFFFGAGVIFRSAEQRLSRFSYLAIPCFLFLCFAATRHFSGMNNGAKLQDIITLPLTGIAGFLMTYYLSGAIDHRGNRIRRLLVFIGDNTLYIFILHIICYKPVSLIKIWWYGLDFRQIGCHMVIHDHNGDLFWILYSVAGVALPLLLLTGARSVGSMFREIRNRKYPVSAVPSAVEATGSENPHEADCLNQD